MDGEDAQVAAASKQANKPKATHTHTKQIKQIGVCMYCTTLAHSASLMQAHTHMSTAPITWFQVPSNAFMLHAQRGRFSEQKHHLFRVR